MDLERTLERLERGWGVRALKGLFALAGIALGILGIFGCLAVYLVVMPSIDTAENAVLAQVDAFTATLDDVEAGLGGASDAAAAVPRVSGNLSTALDSYSNSTGRVAGSLESIASAFNAVGVPQSATAGLSDSAAEMRATSTNLKNASASFSELTNSTTAMATDLENAKQDVAGARKGLREAKGQLLATFGGIKLGLTLMLVVFVLALLAIVSYSVSALL